MIHMSLGNRLEGKVQEFWKLSRAWRRDPIFVGNHTFQTIIEGLHPLTVQGEWHVLRSQADDLVDLAVRGKLRRKKGTIKSKVIQVDFTTKEVKTRKTGRKKVAQQAVTKAA